jgi:hypothetical protein
VDSKWQGWAAMAGILMVIVGGFKAFSGVIGLFNDEWIVRGFNAYYFIDLTALAWWYIIIGVILVLAGLAAMQMKGWGRWVGVIAVGLAMISEFMWLPVYPIWSILLITMYFFMIIGLVIARPSE